MFDFIRRSMMARLATLAAVALLTSGAQTRCSVGDPVDMISGWVTDTANKGRWGRPVDAIPDGKQGLYISDDMSGTIYQLTSR